MLERILSKLAEGYDVEICDVTDVPTFYELYTGVFEQVGRK